MAEIGELERKFIEKRLDTIVKVDLLMFLHKNPSTVGNARDFAHKINREEKDVEKALAEFLRFGLVRKLSTVGPPTYNYTPPERWAPIINKVVKYLSTPEGRSEIYRKLF